MPLIEEPSIPKRLYILDCGLSSPKFSQGRIISCRTDGSDPRPIIEDLSTLPDGIAIDHQNGHIYWTNMGTSLSTNSGSIERANLDGSDRRTIISTRSTGVWTPKQICIAKKRKKLYWCDREGMKVMRSSLDGSNVEVLVTTGSTAEERAGSEDVQDKTNWCVGIAVDEQRGWFYWCQKGPSKGNSGRIFRGRIEDPKTRETLFENLPEPIDMEAVEEDGVLYWTDRGDPPKGNTLNRAYVGGKKENVGEVELLASRFHETIGLSLDKEMGKAYVSDLAGGVYAVDMKTGKKSVLLSDLGDLTGIAMM